MKCIYDKQEDVAIRVKADDAERLVKADPKRYCYTTKQRWKSYGRLYRGRS